MTAARLEIRVIPRAGANAIAGERDGRLLVRVTAPPADGAANDAVIATIAAALRVPKRDVTIVHGARGRQKTLAIAGLTDAALRQALASILAR